MNDFYLLIAALPALTCLWWAVTMAVDFIFCRKRMKTALPFFIFVVVSSFLYITHFIHFSFPGTRLAVLSDSVWIFCTLSVYPLFGIWVHRLTVPQKHRSLKGLYDYRILFAISLAMSALSAGFSHFGLDTALLMLAVKGLFAVEVILTIVIGSRDLRTFRREVANYYSDTYDKELRPVGILLILLLVVSGCSLVFSTIGRDVFLGKNLLIIPSLIFSVLLYSVCYIGNQPVFDITDFEAELKPEEAAPAAKPHSLSQDQLRERIRRAMEEEKIYRMHGLKVDDLAAKVGSNRTYVSNCINRAFGVSFSDYIASYRVEEAKERLAAAPKGTNMEKIGWESGFSTRSQFYRSFKKETGISPGQWLDKTS